MGAGEMGDVEVTLADGSHHSRQDGAQGTHRDDTMADATRGQKPTPTPPSSIRT